MGKFLAGLVKDIADGKYGAKPKALYWWAAGRKTNTAMILAGAAAALYALSGTGQCAECGKYAEWIVWAAGILGTVGLYDSAVRIEPPMPPKV